MECEIGKDGNLTTANGVDVFAPEMACTYMYG